MSNKLIYTIYNSNGYYPVFENDIKKSDIKTDNNYKIKINNTNTNKNTFVSQLDMKQIIDYLHR